MRQSDVPGDDVLELVQCPDGRWVPSREMPWSKYRRPADVPQLATGSPSESPPSESVPHFPWKDRQVRSLFS